MPTGSGSLRDLSIVVEGLSELHFGLIRRPNLEKYRQILSYPTWSFLRQVIVETRSYEEGLEGALVLLDYTEENSHRLGKKEYETNLSQLYFLILEMLDKQDRWEDYLHAWNQIRENTGFLLTYDRKALEFHSPRIEPFIVRKGTEHVFVHFLWVTSPREELIERKVARKRAGKKLGNLMHAHPQQLFESERKRRLDRILEQARQASRYARWSRTAK